MMSSTLLMLTMLAGAPPAIAESDAPVSTEVQLGAALFESPLLSSTRTVSCATCHDPARSFTDGRPQSIGVLGVEVGRNTPTLWGLAHVAGYPSAVHVPPNGAVQGPIVLSLEERCVAPIENPVEMGQTVNAVVTLLNDDPTWLQRFETVYGAGSGASRERLGSALAAYVRTLDPPESPYGAYLAGDASALDRRALDGLEVFTGAGRCNACHSGPALSDGLMHLVTPAMLSRRSLARRSAPNARQLPARQTGGRRGSFGGYGGIELRESHTLTLWDVARTAPYFRDGTVTDLEKAVRQHAADLRAVVEGGHGKGGGVGQITRFNALIEVPEALRPKRAEDELPPVPDAMSEEQIDALVAFLHALSPVAAEPLAPGLVETPGISPPPDELADAPAVTGTGTR